MFLRILLTALLSIVPAVSGEAAPVAVSASGGKGQGFAFLSNGSCYVVTPLHVLGIDGQAAAADSVEATVTINRTLSSPATRPRIVKWLLPEFDTALLLVSNRLVCESNEIGGAPSNRQEQILYRSASGTIEYFPVTIHGESNKNEILITDATDSCNFVQGRSGSLVLDKENRILGMLTSTADCRKGRVIDFKRVNAVLAGSQSHLRIPLHEQSYNFMQAAYEGNEALFNSLLPSMSDANATDGSGNIALERVVTTYNNLGRFRTIAGLQQRPGEDYRDSQQRLCSAWMGVRLRMAKSLLAKGARVDGNGGVSWTPLMSAVTYQSGNCDNTAMARLLLDNGAAPNHVQRMEVDVDAVYLHTPLMRAVDDGPPDTVKILLEKGADPNMRADSKNGNNLTPLLALAVASNPSHVKGPDPSLYCWNSDNSNVEKFRLLARISDKTLKVSASDDYRTAKYANLTVEQILRKRLDGGCKFRACEGDGRTGPGRCMERMLGVLVRP